MTDRLLEWISYRESGRLNDLPFELVPDRRPYRVMEDLAVLGHIELDGDRWHVAPPVLAALGEDSENSATAVLCGARTRGLTDRLSKVCAKYGAETHSVAQTERPECTLVTAATSSLLCTIAAEAALNWQRDAAFTLLASLPAIAAWPRKPCEMVAGKVEEVRRFSKSSLRWMDSSLDEARDAVRGLFQIKRDWNSIVLLKDSKDSQSEIDAAAGRLAVVAGARKLHLDLKTRSLRMPAALRPPTLITRSLALCSGMLPEFGRERRELTFRGISHRTAHLATSITGLKLA
ncbi:hypothetical protein JQ557_05835 [Bradyrhizobium sp. U87765 SZCCT0131]|uniref:hypothetical protein n=1 Tax=unclassified Bradyrhizobium TaxID=2631580 RepID=UPI001BA80AC1|nr:MULTISPECIES: hypothetical protein [unclassified Bradyrhizobium]MBR1217497.1 hypothetical protein [Bradyrhizobium sp. U87765 SZCCT0131]MBR1264905.1 hypothetical protein [Bradyrhizobium sp. U87765 SZCCT0134]MBR1304887.1 hypothetical protein [Bradyrhizobium sp. U87765 SZCCT0110]MBR1320674.1 hypothetical protein [Bradyrhizobium sp. U87765 SZCCT0109]MBR1349094.1 hypothetical protein [Bradyrhizobium sp. U87765 SZCCT0048]